MDLYGIFAVRRASAPSEAQFNRFFDVIALYYIQIAKYTYL